MSPSYVVRAQGARRSAWHEDDLAAVVLLLIEHLVAHGRFFEGQAVGDDQLWLQASCLDVFKKFRQIFLHMGLAHLEGKAFVEGIAKQKAVNEAGINARHAHYPATAHCCKALAQSLATAALDFFWSADNCSSHDGSKSS